MGLRVAGEVGNLQHDCAEIHHPACALPVRGEVIEALRRKGNPHDEASLCVRVHHYTGLVACGGQGGPVVDRS